MQYLIIEPGLSSYLRLLANIIQLIQAPGLDRLRRREDPSLQQPRRSWGECQVPERVGL